MAMAAPEHDAPSPAGEVRPPFLRRVRIRGYKSIAFCDVPLQPLTILVGRNSSGKSNFLDALAFLRDVLAKGTDEAVQSHGGRKAILPRSGRSFIVSFELELTITYQNDGIAKDLTALYDVAVKLPPRSRPFVVSERVAIRDFDKEIKTVVDRKGEQVQWRLVGDRKKLKCPPDRLVLGLYWSYPLIDLNNGLLASRFHNFAPESIRELQEPMPGARLRRDGGNLAGVIKDSQVEGRDTIDRVRDYLSAIVEEVEGFDVVRYGEYETIRFLVRSGGGKTKSFDAASMSDGTLRALAALVAAFNVPLADGPGVVGIEEPETALHPAAVRVLVDALDEASGRNQIILTTHSAEILSDPDIEPSKILVVRNRDGQTQITPVDAASRLIIEKELYSLADLQRQDLLDLDEADLRRQDALRSGDPGE